MSADPSDRNFVKVHFVFVCTFLPLSCFLSRTFGGRREDLAPLLESFQHRLSLRIKTLNSGRGQFRRFYPRADPHKQKTNDKAGETIEKARSDLIPFRTGVVPEMLERITVWLQ